MNKKWSEELKKIRVLLKNEKNFFEGKKKLLEFRYELFCEWEKFFDIQRDFLFEMPYPNSKGYDCLKDGNWQQGVYTRVHRDQSIVNAMRSWMGLNQLTEIELYNTEHIKFLEK